MLPRDDTEVLRPAGPPWRRRAFEIIFQADTPPSRAFDVALIVVILMSVGAVFLESVASVRTQYFSLLRAAEWGFTAVFTVEYLARLAVVRRPKRYATSFFGIVDLLAVLPTYLSIFVPGAQYFLVVRMLRVLRVFRVLKLVTYLNEANVLLLALRASRRKIEVFLFTVLTLVVIFGALMYVVEGPESGFTSIPRSVYWAIVTLTTVGYGDIAPQTSFGQTIAALIMIIGYGVIAVPTGIVTAELTRFAQPNVPDSTGPGARARRRTCSVCGRPGHDAEAHFCKHCGERLSEADYE